MILQSLQVVGCHCKFNQTYRHFKLRQNHFLPSFSFGRRSKMTASNRHWLSGKGADRVLAGSNANLNHAAPHHLHHHKAASSMQHYNNVSTPTPLPPHHLHQHQQQQQQQQHQCAAHPTHGLSHLGRQQQEHRNQFNRHLAMNLENDMYYTLDLSESQQSPLIQ